MASKRPMSPDRPISPQHRRPGNSPLPSPPTTHRSASPGCSQAPRPNLRKRTASSSPKTPPPNKPLPPPRRDVQSPPRSPSHGSVSHKKFFAGADSHSGQSFVPAAPVKKNPNAPIRSQNSPIVRREVTNTSRSNSLQTLFPAGSSPASLMSSGELELSEEYEESDGEEVALSTKTEAEGIALFNESPTKGIKFLFELDVIKETPDSVASYLRECGELDKKAIGDYLGERDQFTLKVLQLFIKKMDFSDDSFESALRKLLSGFRLPGESQKIERIMEIFAEIYTSQQSSQGPFKSSDAVFVLAYSTIMLNTDLHNPQVKRKMTPEQFVTNNRGINQGQDLPESLLSALYQNIRENEIRMEGSGTFPNALKKGPITVEKKEVYLGKTKKIRNRRHVVLDSDLTLYIFKSIRDEGSSAVAELSLKDGMTIYQPAEDGEKKKEEKVFTLYLTLTPDDTTDAVVSSGWRFILPTAKAFREWVGLFEAHTLCLLTYNPPVVGVPINDEVIAPLNRRVKDTSAQLLFLHRNLAETCRQVEALSKETQGTCNQLRDLKRRTLTHNPSSAMGGCLSVAIKMLEDVAQFSSSLEISLQEVVCQPLLDLSHTEVRSAKDHVRSFVGILNTQCEVADKLKKEIQAQSSQNKGDRTKTQKLFAESQKLEEKVEASRQGVREALHDITFGCDRQIVSSFHQMIHSYYSFYKDGASRLSEIWEEAQQVQKLYEGEIPQQMPTAPRPSSVSLSSGTGSPLSQCSPNESQNVQFKMDFSAVKTGTFSKKKKKKGNWKKYYFTLKRKYLYYFVRFSHNLDYKGVIMLRNCSVIPLDSGSGCHFAICTQIDTHYFLVSSTEERREWMEEIEKCVKNDSGFKRRESLNELDEIAESFKRQNEIVVDKKKGLKNLLASTDSYTDEMHLNDPDIIKQGMLQKRGDKVKNWTQRWFALKQNRMIYYEVLPSGELKPRGTIHLLNSVVKHSERELKPFCLEIHHEYRTYYISAKDEAEESSWIDAILQSTTKLGDPNDCTREASCHMSVSPFPRRQSGPEKSGSVSPNVRASNVMSPGDSFIPEGKVLKSGYLTKKGGVRTNWTNRYFELRLNSLTYYRSPGDTPKGNIVLESSSIVKKVKREKKPYSFSIAQETMGAREYWLAAADGKEEGEWVGAIEECIFDLQLSEKMLSKTPISPRM